MPDKTITILNDIPIFAGIGQYNRDLIELLLSNGYKVKNVSYNSYVFDNSNFSNVRLQRPFERFKFSQNLITITNSNLFQFRKFLTPPVLIASQFLIPLGLGKDDVAITVHDITQMHMTGYDFLSSGLTSIKLHLLRKYKNIIVDSNFVKQDILEHFRLDDDSVHVLYSWINLRNIQTFGTLKRMIDPKNISLIHVGSDIPNKNVRLLYKVLRSLPPSYTLIRVGTNSKRNLKFLKENNLLGRVKFYEGISKEKLEDLYNSSHLFLYPSKYEGFGRPLLEAMAHGLPIIYRNSSSLPEIAGNAGIAFDGDDVDTITEAIQKITDKDNYSQQSAKSIERSKFFDITNQGSITIKFIDELLK